MHDESFRLPFPHTDGASAAILRQAKYRDLSFSHKAKGLAVDKEKASRSIIMRMRRTYHAHDNKSRVPVDRHQSASRQGVNTVSMSEKAVGEAEETST